MEIIKEDEIKNIDLSENNENEQNISDSQVPSIKSPVKSPVRYSVTNIAFSKESLDNKDDVNQKQESTTEIKTNLQELETVDVKEKDTDSDIQENDMSTIINKTCDKANDILKENIEHEEENIESVDNDYIVESINDTKTIDIPETEEQDLLEEQDIDMNESEELKTEEQLIEDKNLSSEIIMDTNIDKKEDEEVYFINQFFKNSRILLYFKFTS